MKWAASTAHALRPTSKAQYSQASHPKPASLFSHNDQQNTWQALAAEGATRGWGGRMGDALAAMNSRTVFTSISASGNAVWLAGQTVQQYQVSSGGAIRMGADGNGGSSLYLRCVAPTLPGGFDMGHSVGMNGREVFKFAVRVLGESGAQVLAKSGLTSADVDWVIPHQANVRIIEAAMQRFGIPMDKTVVNLDRYGNTSSATVPMALDEAVQDGRVQDGQQLLLIAFGGGLSWVAGTMKWWGGAPSLNPAQAAGVSA